MNKHSKLFLLIFIFSLFTQNIQAYEQSDKENIPFEITSIAINDQNIVISGWGMLTQQQHFNSSSTHSYTLELVSNKNHKLSFTSKPLLNDQTKNMHYDGIPTCKKNALRQPADVCNYTFTYSGFKFTIPFSQLKVGHSYSATLAIYAKNANVTKRTPIFYPILTPIVKNIDVTEYKIAASLYDTSLKVIQTAVYELKEPKKGAYRKDKVYCSGHGYIRYYGYHSIYNNIYDRVVKGNATYYKVKTDRLSKCVKGRNIVKEGSYYASWILSNFVDYAGESLHIEVSDINHAPIITILQHPVIEKGQSIRLLDHLTAFDEEDGTITHKIKQITPFKNQKIGTQDIVFEVTDSHGKSAQATMVVTVIKGNRPPKIQVSNQIIYQYDPFDPLENASASDEEDGPLTHKIKTTGGVDTSTLGTYEVTYKVKDSKGATDEKTIQVEVKRNPREKIRYISKKESKLFYHESVPKNWKDKIQFLIEQLENPKQFAQSSFRN